jgi:hypothetical protein
MRWRSCWRRLAAGDSRKRFPCFRVGSGPRKGRLGALWLLEIFLFCFCGGAEDRGGG